MAFTDVYIGNLDDPKFKWDKGDWNGNLPTRQSPFFPQPAPFNGLVDLINKGELNGIQADWGGWVASVSKKDLLNFFNSSYLIKTKEINGKSLMPGSMDEKFQTEYDLCKKYIDSLDSDKNYALVASEI